MDVGLTTEPLAVASTDLFALVLDLMRDLTPDQDSYAVSVMVRGMHPWTVGDLATTATGNLPEHSIAIINRKLWAEKTNQR